MPWVYYENILAHSIKTSKCVGLDEFPFGLCKNGLWGHAALSVQMIPDLDTAAW